MRATRRRPRTPDPLASPDAVRFICQSLRERLPEIIPKTEKDLLRFLNAIRHIERRPATDTRRGRPSHWSHEDMMMAAGVLRGILERETQGRVSLSSFVTQYISLLHFPADVTEALASGDINLQEAASLARLTAERLGCSPQTARAHRREILRSHLAVQGSQTRLRACVKEALGETALETVPPESMAAVVAQVDELLEIDPQDSRHLFWEEMKRVYYAMREIKLDDLDEEMMEEFMKAMDQVSLVLHRIERRRKGRNKQAKN